MADPRNIIARQMEASGATLLLAFEPVSDEEFYAANATGFSAAWTIGHLACVDDLFSSWLCGGRLLLDHDFHKVFNETSSGTAPDPGVRRAAAEKYPKAELLLKFRQARVKALRVLSTFSTAQWDTEAPPGTPLSLPTGGSVWEHLGRHVDWHLGELAGSMKRFEGTYTLNMAPHYFYVPPE
jgi:hypothetical protein